MDRRLTWLMDATSVGRQEWGEPTFEQMSTNFCTREDMRVIELGAVCNKRYVVIRTCIQSLSNFSHIWWRCERSQDVLLTGVRGLVRFSESSSPPNHLYLEIGIRQRFYRNPCLYSRIREHIKGVSYSVTFAEVAEDRLITRSGGTRLAAVSACVSARTPVETDTTTDLSAPSH